MDIDEARAGVFFGDFGLVGSRLLRRSTWSNSDEAEEEEAGAAADDDDDDDDDDDEAR